MSTKRSVHRQVQQYDKIFRENLEAALPGLIKNLLGIQALYAEELPDDIQHTKERKPDVLKKVTDKAEATFVLHIEFQVKDEPEMAFRMAEYFIMLLRKYKIPVRQYVIYIGEGTPSMPDHIRSGPMHFKFQLIPISSIDYQVFLRSKNPEEKMLSILGDLGNGDDTYAIEAIARQVFESSDGDFAKMRHMKQLRILAGLRNLAPEKLLIMDSLVGVFTAEKDILYRIGELKGMQKAKAEDKTNFVKSLLLNTDFPVARIAGIVKVSEYFVRKIKKSLK